MFKSIGTKFTCTLIILMSLVRHSYSASMIRDIETEKIIRSITKPLLRAANLNTKDVKIFIINDKQLNAFVYDGQNIFLNSGLILFSDKPDILAGTIAHEIGHIAGAHLARSRSEIKNAYIKTAIGYALGLIASLAADSPKAAEAAILSGGHIASLGYLKYSRMEEESADQAALKYLNIARYPNDGLLKLLNKFYKDEVSLYKDINKYSLTHPLSKSRVLHIQNYIKNSKENSTYLENKFEYETIESFARIFAKISAFTKPYNEIFRLYPKNSKTVNARYAHAIAYYKKSDIRNSLKELDILVKSNPKNPYFYELKAQMLFESQKIKESVKYYEKALQYLPGNPLIKIELAKSLVASKDKNSYKKAILNLKSALISESSNKSAWHQLGIAYGRIGKIGESNLALAEKSLIERKKDNALKYIKTAKKYLKKNTSSYIHMKDLELYIKNTEN